MKLFYITNARIPTEKAHGLQIIKMCEAFQQQGLHVELIVPFRMQSPAMKRVSNIWEYYQVDTPFAIRHLWGLDFVRLTGKIPESLMMCLYYLQAFIFSLFAFVLTIFKPNSIYYSRDLQTIFLFCLTKWIHRKKVYFEAHEFHGDPNRSKRWFHIMRWMLRRLDGIIVITHQLKTLYVNMGGRAKDIWVAPDGVDKKRLLVRFDKAEARKKLHIPLDRKIICYTGHLFVWKGVYALAESVRYLPEDYVMYIVGGMESDITMLQGFVSERQLQNIIIPGQVPYHDVPMYLAAADVLVLPNTATAKISREYTSPLKLFEYMGARRPIVASDLPSLREILQHKKHAYLVPPDNPEALAEGLVAVIHDRRLSQMITEAAYQEVQAYTWDVRAKNIVQFITHHTS